MDSYDFGHLKVIIRIVLFSVYVWMFSLNTLLPKVILCLQNVAFKQQKTKFTPPRPAKIVKKPYYHLPVIEG